MTTAAEHQADILAHYRAHPGLEATAYQIARVLGWTRSGTRARRLLEGLEAQGAVEHYAHQGDHKCILWREANGGKS